MSFSKARFYHEEGRDLVSVTTALDILSKPALPPWYAKQERLTFEQAIKDAVKEKVPHPELFKWVVQQVGEIKAGEKKAAVAAKLGKSVHAAIDCHLRGDVAPRMSTQARKVFKSWLKWWESARLEVIAVEKMVYDLELGYAGTFDLLARHPEHGVILFDWKLTNYLYNEHDLQNIAYRHAAAKRGMPSDKGVVVRLPKDGKPPEPHLVNDEENTIEDFARCLALWKWRQKVSRWV